MHGESDESKEEGSSEEGKLLDLPRRRLTDGSVAGERISRTVLGDRNLLRSPFAKDRLLDCFADP
jgi:hypothetical protein